MTLPRFATAALLLLAASSLTPLAWGDAPPAKPPAAKPDAAAEKPDAPKYGYFKPEEKGSEGSVTIGGAAINYHAVAGTLVVHPKDWDDAPDKPIDGGGDKGGGDADKKPGGRSGDVLLRLFQEGC